RCGPEPWSSGRGLLSRWRSWPPGSRSPPRAAGWPRGTAVRRADRAMASPSPISRTINHLLELGYDPENVRRRTGCTGGKRRWRGLYGFIDVLAILPGGAVLGVRVLGPRANVGSQLCRVIVHPRVIPFASTAAKLQIWKWKKRGGRWYLQHREPVCPPTAATAVRLAADLPPAISPPPERDLRTGKPIRPFPAALR